MLGKALYRFVWHVLFLFLMCCLFILIHFYVILNLIVLSNFAISIEFFLLPSVSFIIFLFLDSFLYFLFSFYYFLFIFFIFSDSCLYTIFYVFALYFLFYNSLKWSTQHMKVSGDLLGKVEVQIFFFLKIWTSPSGSSLFVIIAQYSSALSLLIITWYVLLGLTGNPLSSTLLIPLGGSLM